MATPIDNELAGLRRERHRLEDILSRNDDWTALQRLNGSTPAQDPSVAKQRRKYERALTRNTVFVAHKALSKAIALLESMPVVIELTSEGGLEPTTSVPQIPAARATGTAEVAALSEVEESWETEVEIVQPSAGQRTDGGTAAPTRSLLARLRDTKPSPEPDGAHVVFQGEIEPAEVEIVHPRAQGEPKDHASIPAPPKPGAQPDR